MSLGRELKITNDSDPQLLMKLSGHKKKITDLSFRNHPEKKQFATCSKDGAVVIWNPTKEAQYRCYNFKGHKDAVNGVDFAPQGHCLASCSSDGEVFIWEPLLKGKSYKFKAHTSSIRSIKLSSDKILTGSNDKSLKLWNLKTRQFITSFRGHNAWVRSVDFLSGSSLVASCSEDRTIKLWDTNSGKVTMKLSCFKSCPISISALEDKYLAAGLDNGSLRIYDLKAGRLRQHHILHEGSVTSVSWHPNMHFLLSSGEDGKAMIVDVMEGRALYTINLGEIIVAKFDSSGEEFFAVGDNVYRFKSNLDY